METKRIFHHYFLFNACKLEAWLKEQAKNGWSLIDKKGYNFYFIKASSKEREYLVTKQFTLPYWCNSIKQIEKSIEEFPLKDAKEKYKNSNSILNKKQTDVFEVGLTKIDADYNLLKAKRNKYYFKKYRTEFLNGIALLFLFVVITLCDNNCWPSTFLSVPHLIYGLIGMIKCKKN